MKCPPAAIMFSKSLLLVRHSFTPVRHQIKGFHVSGLVYAASSDRPQFPGSRSSWTEKLEFLKSDAGEGIPVYRVMNRDGKVIDSSQDPQLGEEKSTKIYKGKSRAIGMPHSQNLLHHFRNDAAQYHGQDSVRVTATGSHLFLHDSLWGGGNSLWLSCCSERR